VIEFLQKLPTVIVKSEEGLTDLMPGSGGNLTILEVENYSLQEIGESVLSCLSGLHRNFELLKQHKS